MARTSHGNYNYEFNTPDRMQLRIFRQTRPKPLRENSEIARAVLSFRSRRRFG